MRYCDKCGAEITSGGHKSNYTSFTGTDFLCDDCYAAEEKTPASIVARLVIGVIVGMGGGMGLVCALESLFGKFSNTVQSGILIAMEILLIGTFIACKIGRMRLRSRFLKSILGLVAYLTFWVVLVMGVLLFIVLKWG